MIKRAVILHGTDGSPESNWLPWAKRQLEARGYSVFIPQLPECHTPNKSVYDSFLHESNWDFTDNVVIGHSSGATTVLNLLSSEWFPRIEKAILVGTFLNVRKLDNVSWYEPGQFDNLFNDTPYDVDLFKAKVGKFFFVHGDDDPYCDVEDARRLCDELGATFLVIDQGLHLSSNRVNLPEITQFL
ncbi:alpha/beta hydrolase [Microbacteriaceae bacterium]|nr:alpha/beta hydrolase [Candidatus Saccharibacteria bacterium]